MHVIKVYKGINERKEIMKQIIKNLMKHTRHAELVSASQVNPLLSLRDTLPQGRENTLCAKHTDKNLSTYRLNVLETDKTITPTLSRICKFAYRSLTNSTLSQRERVKCPAFTLAETLITLGIIGVVAALTIAPLVQKYRIKQLEVAFKHSSSMIEQALLKTANEFGYGSIKDLTKICGYPHLDNKNNIDNEHPNTIYYNNCLNEYQTKIIPEMYQDFISNFHVIKTYTFEDCMKPENFRNKYTYTYYGNRLRVVCALHTSDGFNILENGISMTRRFYFLYHGWYDGFTFVFDTNGPNKGPNRFGYDIFIYNTGNWGERKCTAKNVDTNGHNSYACYDYALQDKNPDDDTKGYWESLKL